MYGIVPDVFGENQKEFILNKRTKESLENKLINLLNNYYMFEILSKENFKQIQNWDWKIKCKEFETFFKHCLI